MASETEDCQQSSDTRKEARTGWRGKIAALLELVGVFIGGTMAGRYAASALGVPAASLRSLRPGATVDYLQLAGITAANLLLRYGIILGLAFAIGWWHRRRKVRDYGVTAAALSWRDMAAIATVMFAVGGFLPKLLLFAKDYIPLGREPQHWRLLNAVWSADFWVYMAVSSFVLVPVVEELFFRGYVQTRLTESFGAPAAIVMTALFFTLSHRQYFLASPIGAGMLVSLLLASLIAGYARYRFGSLIPGMLAHALGNIPVRGAGYLFLLPLMLIVLLPARTAVLMHIRDGLKLVATWATLAGLAIALTIVPLVLGIAAIFPSILVPLSVVCVATALLLEYRDRKTVAAEAGPV